MKSIYSKLFNILFYLFCLLFIITLLSYPKEIFFATKTGILLWHNNILPSLFGFIIVINLLTNTNFILYITRLFENNIAKFFKCSGHSISCMIFGLLSGYPMGAKLVSNLLLSNQISEDEASKALCISNNCGPIFILSAISLNMFKNINIGYLLIGSEILTAFTLAFMFKFYKNSITLNKRNTTKPNNDIKFSSVISDSISNAIDTIINIGGIIIFFCIITKICELYKLHFYAFKFISIFIPYNIDYTIFTNLFYSNIEITNGIYLLSISNISELHKILITSFLINFGGLCIMFQTYNLTYMTKVNFKFYFIHKILAGFISIFYTLILYKIFL